MLMKKEDAFNMKMQTVLNGYTVDQYMSTHILVGKEDFTITHIARLFDEMKIHHLPIVDEGRKVVGIITANDMVRIWSSLVEEGTNSLKKSGKIMDYMSKNPICCKPETTIAEAVRLFDEGRFHAVPVVEEEELVGIFTANDLISFLNEVLDL